MQHLYSCIEGWFDFEEVYERMVDTFVDKARFVEVGSWKGKSAAFLAEKIITSEKNIKVDCVDTWEGSAEHTNPNSAWYEEQIVNNPNYLYFEFIKNTRPVEDVITPIKASSKEAAEIYEDRSLDFVFLDASHDYENVLIDLTIWYPKIKKGGYIGGHDYGGENFAGVDEAVNEFFKYNVEAIGNSFLRRK
tara:strand:+ start:318 stop:890 length:573 start_codon:yes stop_codon:yes gene_type:complete